MGILSELEMAIKDLRSPAATINDVADTLAEMFSTASADETHDDASPAEPVLTLEQVRAVLADKSRLGFTAEIDPFFRSTAHPSCPASIPFTTRHWLPKRRC